MTAEDAPTFGRRTFVKGVAAAGLAVAGAAGATLWVRSGQDEPPPALPWRTSPHSLVFDQSELTEDEQLHRSGCRRSAAPTAGYADDAVAKATVLSDPDEAPPRLVLPGALAGLVIPAAGLVPRDEWAARVEVRNASERDVTDLPAHEEPYVFLTAGGIVLWMLSPGEVAVTSFVTGQQLTWRMAPGDWPSGAWRRFTIRWRRTDATLQASVDDAPQDRLTAGRPEADPPPADPVGGTDDGVMLGGSPSDPQPFEIRAAQLHRAFDGGATGPSPPPRLTIDATRATGPWAPGLSGTLAVAAGFDLDVGSTQPDLRARQYELVYDEAGSRLVRVGGPLQLIDITFDDEGAGDPTYGWDRLDDHLDALLVDRPGLRLHLTLDFTPPVLQPPGGDHRSPPTDPQRWATIATDVVAHVADRYGSQLAFVSLWNEPDYDQFWTGTDEQLYDLWARTQTALLAARSEHLLGSPEYAFTPGIEGFFAWLAGQDEDLRASVDAVYVHDFQQDLRLVRERLRAAREAATAAGVVGVPLRVTEYNLALGQIVERREDPTSWYRTQPPHFTTEYAAAWAVHFLWEVLDEDARVDTAIFAAIGAQELFWGEQALVTSSGEIRPYPTWSTIALLARLSGERIDAVANTPAVRALATRAEDGTVTVVLGSFRPYRGFLEDIDLDLDWAGLPERFTWTQWQLDRDHLVDHRMVEVGSGDEGDLPSTVRIGALGIGGIEIVPA